MLDRPALTRAPFSEAAPFDPTILAAIVESAGEAIVACRPDGRVATWNAGASEMFGVPASEMVGTELSRLVPPGPREGFARLLREAAGGSPSGICPTLGQRPDGRLINLSVTIVPMRSGGAIQGIAVIARDVTAGCRAEDKSDREELMEREGALRRALTALRESHEDLKQTQRQRVEAVKLDSVGRLAAGVAHEVRNPLAMIVAGTDFLLSLPAVANEPAAEPVLRDIRSAVERASAVIAGLLKCSATTDLNVSTAGLNSVVEQALLLVRHALKGGRIRVEKELAGGLPPLSLDVPKVQHVFINLLLNAIDAMPEGGTLTVRTQRRQLTSADEFVGHRRTDALRVGEVVQLASVIDTGTGIPPEHLARLFDPFFTTKPTGMGTGLGLALCRSIIALHGGTIWISNRPEGGITATVVLRSATVSKEEKSWNERRASC